MKILEVKNINKKYRDRGHELTALDKISFDLEEGEDMAIMGPSGSGKTTLLQIISGLNEPTSGEVLINGKNIFKGNDNQVSEFRNKTLGFVFQNVYLQDYFTALENVMLPMLVAGKKRNDAKRKAAELLKMVGLEDRMHHRPNKLSGGEEQRVGIARALANDPKILMADEPTAKLDKANRDIVLKIFKEINQKGISLIVITHDEYFSENFSKTIVLERGKVTRKNFS